MKRILKIIILNICFITLILNVSAENLTDYCADAPDGTRESCTNTVTFCYEDKEYVGCPFDQTKKIYSTSATNNDGTEGTGIYGSASFPFDIININPDIPLERSYVALDNNNRVGFVGCYKGQIYKELEDPSDEFSSANYTLVKSCSGDNCLGSAYFFKIITANEKTCNPQNDGFALYIATDTKMGGMFTNEYYNESINMHIGKDNWTPSSTGNCPKYLNFNPNVNSWMDSINRYRISDDQKIDYDKSVYSAVSNFFNQQYNQNHALTGCTTEDTAGFEEMKKCFETKAEDIKKFTCPSDKSGYDTLVTKYNSYQKECKSKYDELYAKKLIDADSKKYLTIIIDAAYERIDECYAQTCNVDNNKIKQYTAGKQCSNGCIDDEKDQSDSSNASCWMCGSNPYTYHWITDDEKSKYSSCHPETSVKKEDCYGTTETKDCFLCLESAYKSAGLTETQIKCLNEANEVKNYVYTGIKSSSDEHDDEQNKDNASRTHNPTTFKIPTPGGAGFGREADCSEVMKGPGYTMIHGIVRAVQLLAPVVAIVIAMITLMPAVTAKDEAGIKKASKTCVTIGVVLVVIEVMPYIVLLIGRILGYDLTCLL